MAGVPRCVVLGRDALHLSAQLCVFNPSGLSLSFLPPRCLAQALARCQSPLANVKGERERVSDLIQVMPPILQAAQGGSRTALLWWPGGLSAGAISGTPSPLALCKFRCPSASPPLAHYLVGLTLNMTFPGSLPRPCSHTLWVDDPLGDPRAPLLTFMEEFIRLHYKCQFVSLMPP